MLDRDQLPKSKDITDNHKEIKSSDYEWLWTDDWYDGPLSGMIKHNKKEYWTETFDETDWTEWEGPRPEDTVRMRTRFFVVLELTQEQYDCEYYWHSLWVLCGEKIANDATRKFYHARQSKDRKDLDLTNHNIIGWFAE